MLSLWFLLCELHHSMIICGLLFFYSFVWFFVIGSALFLFFFWGGQHFLPNFQTDSNPTSLCSALALSAWPMRKSTPHYFWGRHLCSIYWKYPINESNSPLRFLLSMDRSVSFVKLLSTSLFYWLRGCWLPLSLKWLLSSWMEDTKDKLEAVVQPFFNTEFGSGDQHWISSFPNEYLIAVSISTLRAFISSLSPNHIFSATFLLL